MTVIRTQRVEAIMAEQAPRNLLPYLDCCDAAWACGAGWSHERKVPLTVWALFRGGREVGRITLDGPPTVGKLVRPRPPSFVEIRRPNPDAEHQIATFMVWLLVAFLAGAALWSLFVLGSHYPA